MLANGGWDLIWRVNFLPSAQQLWAPKGGMVPRIVGCRYLMQKTRLERIPVWYITVHKGGSNEVQISGRLAYWILTKLVNVFFGFILKSKYVAVCRQGFIMDHSVLKSIYNVVGVHHGSLCFKIHLYCRLEFIMDLCVLQYICNFDWSYYGSFCFEIHL